MRTFKINKQIFIIISLIAVILSSFSFFNDSYNKGEAFSACKSVGSFVGTNEIESDISGIANPDAGGRKWTAEELFRGSVAFTSFYGEGKSNWFFAEKLNRGESKEGWTSDVQTRLEASRGYNCGAGGMDWAPQMFLSMTSGITSFTGGIVKSLVGEDQMAETITKIVGGDDTGNNGLVGTFFSSFYMPLVVIAFLIMAVTIIYKGLIKMQFREALSSIIWSFMAFLIGIALMLNPQMLASAPQAITSTITTCVIGALSGQNCLSGEITTPSPLTGDECLSTVTGEGNSSESVVNSLNCTIWKAFVLEPWAESQFGDPYSKLYTKDPPPGGEIWSSLPEGAGDKYCVNLGSTKSYKDSTGLGGPVMDASGNTICNVALYHLYVKTEMTDPINQSGNNFNDSGVMLTDDTSEYDSRWYDIIIPMAQNESKWRYWSGDGMFFSRLGTSIVSLVGVIAASTVLVTLSVFAGAYKMIGLILVAFAPIFLLFAIEPTRGKKIFLGWLETMVSSFLKYFAITVLIVVALIMYAGLLSNTSGIFSLVGIVVMTVALHMYRKEIVDLIGASNMGGQRLSNKLNEVGEKAWNKTKEKGSATAGGFIGGAFANMGGRSRKIEARKDTISELQEAMKNASSEEDKQAYQEQINKEEEALKKDKSLINAAGTVAQGSISGSADSLKRSFRRGTGVTANIAQQASRTKKELERQAEIDKKEAEKRRADFEDNLIGAAPLEHENEDNMNNDETVVDETGSPTEPRVAIEELVESQREEVNYNEDLSDEEKVALDEFADKLKMDSASDEDLVNLANSEAVMNDENKKALVANEINARIRANSMVGMASNELSRSILANQEFLSDEELKFNFQMHAENFLETGDEAELIKYLNAGSEIADRSGLEFDTVEAESAMKNFKVRVGDSYERKAEMPTESEMKAFEGNYEIPISEKEVLKSDEVTTPDVLVSQAERNKDLIEAAKGLENDSSSNENPDGDSPSNPTMPSLSKDDEEKSDEGTQVPNHEETGENPSRPNGTQIPVYEENATEPGETQIPVYEEPGESATKPTGTQIPVYGETGEGATEPSETQIPAYEEPIQNVTTPTGSQIPVYEEPTQSKSESTGSQTKDYEEIAATVAKPNDTQIPVYEEHTEAKSKSNATQIPVYEEPTQNVTKPTGTQIPVYGETVDSNPTRKNSAETQKVQTESTQENQGSQVENNQSQDSIYNETRNQESTVSNTTERQEEIVVPPNDLKNRRSESQVIQPETRTTETTSSQHERHEEPNVHEEPKVEPKNETQQAPSRGNSANDSQSHKTDYENQGAEPQNDDLIDNLLNEITSVDDFIENLVEEEEQFTPPRRRDDL